MEQSFVVAFYCSSKSAAKRVLGLLNLAPFRYQLLHFGSTTQLTDQEKYAAVWLQPDEWLVLTSQTEVEAGRLQEMGVRSGEIVASTIVSPYVLSSGIPKGALREGWQRAKAELLVTLARQERSASDAFGDSLRAERGIAEAAFQDTVLGISLVEHRYIIDGYVERLDGLLKGKALPRLPKGNQEGSQIPRVYEIASRAIKGLKGEITEERLALWLRRNTAQIDLSQNEYQTLSAMLALRLLEIVSQQTYAEQHDDAQLQLARFASSRLEVLPVSEYQAWLPQVEKLLPGPDARFSSLVMEYMQDGEHDRALLADIWHISKLNLVADTIRRDQEAVSLRLENFYATVGSLRVLARLDWENVIERVSPVALVLATDPAGAYSSMDPATRAWYRNRISEFSTCSSIAERELAQRAVDLAARATYPEARHVGYYLIDEGLPDLIRTAGIQLPIWEKLAQALRSRPAVTLIGSWLILTACLVLLFGYLIGMQVWLVAAALIPASQIGMEVVAFILARLVPPVPLPKLKYVKDIPKDARTGIVVPTLLSSSKSIANDLERLEIRYLANQDKHLVFGLLSDWTDAAQQSVPGDAELLEQAEEGIRSLQKRHPQGTFFLFHRDRKFHKADSIWMGHERKRGKLEDFNALIAGQADGTYLRIGEVRDIQSLAFVITLDQDTELPPGTARRLIETIAHPLNAPRLAKGGRQLRRGFGIIQPRVTTNFVSAKASRLSWLLNNQVGIDPYFVAYSDMYHDVALEAIYHGKGIYEPRVFNSILRDRLPDNRVLSHDLVEGNFVRVALATDIQLFDSFPSTHEAVFGRSHRWIRGDWQVGIWSWLRVPSRRGIITNPFGAIGRFKHFDNLRRSCLPIANVLLALGVLVAFPRESVAVIGLIIVSSVMPFVFYVVNLPFAFVRGTLPWRGFITSLSVSIHSLALIPRNAFVSTDAIARALFRMTFSHRKLLEWRTAADSGNSRDGFDKTGVILSLLCLSAIIFFRPPLAIGLLLLVWSLAPVLQFWLDQPVRRGKQSSLTPQQRQMLRGIALQVWRFFDELMVEEHHYLPPDNLQVALKREVADRTSPTNIGLGLLSWLAIYDLGFITAPQLLTRTQQTLGTLEALAKYRGHIFNWYNTRTLEPLAPSYVSMVDSGNLMGSLWSFSHGLREVADAPLVTPDVAQTFVDLLRELAARAPELPADVLVELSELADKLELNLQLPGNAYVEKLWDTLSVITARGEALNEATRPTSTYLVRRLRTQAEAWTVILSHYLGWYVALLQLTEAERSLVSQEAESFLEPNRAVPSLREVAGIPSNLIPKAIQLSAIRDAQEIIQSFEHEAETALRLADEMDMAFLYNQKRRGFHIGFNVETGEYDPSFYDLLASEARLGSFVAIAAGQVPAEHWWSLGRNSRRSDGTPVLMSWSGTMFEYFMPRLLMKEYPDTLLGLAYRNVVKVQRAYATRLEIPWGISESANATLDHENTYQYQAFGVPALGIQYGLRSGVVVAPYATLLAIDTAGNAAFENLKSLERLGMRGDMGYFDAIDFRRAATLTGERGVGAFTYMAHHQGMGLVSIANAINGDTFQRRFHADLRVQAAEALLQERAVMPGKSRQDVSLRTIMPLKALSAVPVITSTQALVQPIPKTHLLTNGQYHVMVSASGSGYSRLNELEINRWTKDALHDASGHFTYVSEPEVGLVWSTTYAPTHIEDDSYTVQFSPEKAVFTRQIHNVLSRQEVYVAPDHNVEIRSLKIQNVAGYSRKLQVTSYMELGLAQHEAQVGHPAFNKMFIKVEPLEEQDGIVAQRRPRSSDEQPLWAGHVLVNLTHPSSRAQLQTDRTDFLGRDSTLSAPKGLGHTTRAPEYSLDPIAAVTQSVQIEASATVNMVALTIIGSSRDEVLRLANRYRQQPFIARARQTAWTAQQAELQRLQVPVEEVILFNALGSYFIYPNNSLKQSAKGLVGGVEQPLLNELPNITGGLFVAIGDAGDLPLIRTLGLAQQYLEVRGYKIPILIYVKLVAEPAQRLTERLMSTMYSLEWLGDPQVKPTIHVLQSGEVTTSQLRAVMGQARMVLDAADGDLSRQLAVVKALSAGLERPLLALATSTYEPPRLPLALGNGYGGFIEEGRAYRMNRQGSHPTPAPWVNVMANAKFGSLVSESGSGFTWFGNSHDYRLSPARNEPLADEVSEILYVLDLETNEVWSPQLLPREACANTTHRPGLTVLEGAYDHVGYKLEIFVPADEDMTVRIQRLSLFEHGGRARKLRVIAVNDLVLGNNREQTEPFLVTRWDETSQALLAGDSAAFSGNGRVAFTAMSGVVLDFTSDRMEFIGPLRGQRLPFGLAAPELSGRTGSGVDSIAVIRSDVLLGSGEDTTVESYFGASSRLEDVEPLLAELRKPEATRDILASTLDWWKTAIGAIQVATPSQRTNIMLNTWLPYQVLSGRLWGRTGYYQSSGAFGFRDQLQDVLALVYAHPNIVRNHILEAAAHQFVEGDVQHWWQPQMLWGLRTRMTDDRLWLPYVVKRYIDVTGDKDILQESISYLEGRALEAGEFEAYYEPGIAQRKGTLLEHCQRAVDVSQQYGQHELPLMGTGDWNDGYNRVGAEGRGESVWLAWFMAGVLDDMADLSELGHAPLSTEATKLRVQAKKIRSAIDESAWDGEWYIRAYYDDGAALGSHVNDEGQIDLLPQAWAAIDGGGNKKRARTAVESAVKRLVDREGKIVRVLTPAFDHGERNPGYIKGYLPGMRENGGQYTHGSLWLPLALLKLSQPESAVELLELMNPISHSLDKASADHYALEPYVTAGDVYDLPGNVGRGGWSWYTGSAAWMYRIWIEDVLGLVVRGNQLEIRPNIPKEWPGYTLDYRFGSSTYHVVVERMKGTVGQEISLDGKALPSGAVVMVDDSQTHKLHIWIAP